MLAVFAGVHAFRQEWLSSTSSCLPSEAHTFTRLRAHRLCKCEIATYMQSLPARHCGWMWFGWDLWGACPCAARPAKHAAGHSRCTQGGCCKADLKQPLPACKVHPIPTGMTDSGLMGTGGRRARVRPRQPKHAAGHSRCIPGGCYKADLKNKKKKKKNPAISRIQSASYSHWHDRLWADGDRWSACTCAAQTAPRCCRASPWRSRRAPRRPTLTPRWASTLPRPRSWSPCARARGAWRVGEGTGPRRGRLGVAPLHAPLPALRVPCRGQGHVRWDSSIQMPAMQGLNLGVGPNLA